MSIAESIMPIIKLRISFEGKFVSTASAKPCLEIKPKREDISCNIIVARIENNNAHNKEYPNSTPAIVQAVIVPGPINAAAINNPGPSFFTLKI
ncbi:hypothetical protein GCM10011414_14830 [Croceivirga lutea]|nr:hypothetical protein GCM10011414_14830 [Croceivirga lutea]